MMNDPTCVKTISAIITLTLLKLSAATMIPQIVAPRRTIRQPQYPKTPRGAGGCDVLAQKIHNLKNPECRPQLFTNQADASKRIKNNTIKMILGTPLAIRNTILIHKIPQLAEDLRHCTPFLYRALTVGGTNALYEECDTLVGPKQMAATHLFIRVQATILDPPNRKRDIIEMKVENKVFGPVIFRELLDDDVWHTTTPATQFRRRPACA